MYLHKFAARTAKITDSFSFCTVQKERHRQLVEDGIKIRNQPAMMDGAINGIIISLQVLIQLAPEFNAAFFQENVHLDSGKPLLSAQTWSIYFDQIADDQNPHRRIKIETEITGEGDNQSKGDNDTRSRTADNGQQIREATSFDF